MRPPLHPATLACALIAAPVLGVEPVKPTLELSDLRVVVAYVSTGTLANLPSRSKSPASGSASIARYAGRVRARHVVQAI
jgi:hypothetical protein